MSVLAFLAAILMAFAVYDALTLWLHRGMRSDLLRVVVMEEEAEALRAQPRSIWTATLGFLLPHLEKQTLKRARVVDWIRRSGYTPYATPAEFYAALLRSTAQGLLLAALGGFFIASAGLPWLALVYGLMVAIAFYRRPRVRLRQAVERRASLMRQNMLLGLTQLGVFLQAGVSVQEALRRVGQLGGPFCNLLAFFVARLEVEDVQTALRRLEEHIPDPDDVNMRLFLQDLEGYFLHQRPLTRAVWALRDAVRRDIKNATLSRASQVKRRAGLYGILAVLGMLIAGILPEFV